MIRAASKRASTSKCRRAKIGAVAAFGGRVFTVARNAPRNRFAVAPGLATFHAEEMALRRIGNLNQNGILYVARVLANGATGMARPCRNCMEVIRISGVKRVYYTTWNCGIGSLEV
ncbi:hypothetical protein [Streptomyces sp. NPDC090112]|uniref:hypothetical protein n=1 Tax=Streptomyces sp. NPDC090112 TaxID=3365949 RepID=UPI003817A687